MIPTFDLLPNGPAQGARRRNGPLRTPRAERALKTLALTTFLTLGALLGATSRAQPNLTLPAGADWAAHAALVLNDVATPPPGGFDLAAAEDAALAQADRLPPQLWEIDALSDHLGVEPEAAFAFVRDRVAFDPYGGVLRGADGTLAARAGNAWDRALLLRALLEYHGHVTRFAFGALESGAVDALLVAAAQGAAQPLGDSESTEVMTVGLTALATRARRDYALLGQALTSSGVAETLGAATDVVQAGAGGQGGGLTDPRAAIRSHVWLQLEQVDGTWLDLDPSLPDAKVGTTLTAPSGTNDELPAEKYHHVVIRVLAETLEDDELKEAVVLEQALVAASADSSETWLYFQPEVQGLSGTILSVMGEAKWLPVLLVNGEATTGTAFPLGSSGGDDFFGGFLGGGGPQLTRLRLELVTQAPDGTGRTGKRLLYDRIDAGLREAGAVTADMLEPLPDEGVPAALASLHHVLVSTGGANPREQAIGRAFAANFAGNDLRTEDASSAFALQDLLFPLAVADQTVVLASERLLVEGMSRPGLRAYVGEPRVYLVSLTPFLGVEDGTASIIDLALDSAAFAGADSEAEAAHQRVWYGALQSALETELTLARARAVDPDTALLTSVSLRMPDTLTVLRPGDEDKVPPAAMELRTALRNGDVVVSVGPPGPSGAFWAIEPASGATRSVIEPGFRVGFIGGGNYTNASTGAPRYVVDPKTGNTIGHIKDGTHYRYQRKPPSRCSGGTEYLMLLGCVSIPAGMTVGMAYGVIVTAVVSWAIAIIELMLW